MKLRERRGFNKQKMDWIFTNNQSATSSLYITRTITIRGIEYRV